MSLARPYGVGLRNVGSYQVSGQPYLTGSNISGSENAIRQGAEISVAFPYVTKKITLWNYSSGSSGRLRFHLVSSSSIEDHPTSRHYVEIAQNESITLTLKCKEAYLSAIGHDINWKLYASLTNITGSRMYELSGSGINTL